MFEAVKRYHQQQASALLAMRLGPDREASAGSVWSGFDNWMRTCAAAHWFGNLLYQICNLLYQVRLLLFLDDPDFL